MVVGSWLCVSESEEKKKRFERIGGESKYIYHGDPAKPPSLSVCSAGWEAGAWSGTRRSSHEGSHENGLDGSYDDGQVNYCEDVWAERDGWW